MALAVAFAISPSCAPRFTNNRKPMMAGVDLNMNVSTTQHLTTTNITTSGTVQRTSPPLSNHVTGSRHVTQQHRWTSIYSSSTSISTSSSSSVNYPRPRSSQAMRCSRQFDLQGVKRGVGGVAGGSRGWTTAYELSADLREKQLELLEKKYSGGTMQARRAATVIQNAYRHYSMSRNFAKLRWQADEKRLSRRFAEFSRSRTIWSDIAGTVSRGGAGVIREGEAGREGRAVEEEEDGLHSPGYDVMTHSYSADNMLQHLSTAVTTRTGGVNCAKNGKVTALIATNQRLSVNPTDKNQQRRNGEGGGHESNPCLPFPHHHTPPAPHHHNQHYVARSSMGLDLCTINEVACSCSAVATSSSRQETKYVNTLTGDKQNGVPIPLLSDSEDSAVMSPVEVSVDVPSEVVEHLLEDAQLVNDTQQLGDSFHSDESGSDCSSHRNSAASLTGSAATVGNDATNSSGTISNSSKSGSTGCRCRTGSELMASSSDAVCNGVEVKLRRRTNPPSDVKMATKGTGKSAVVPAKPISPDLSPIWKRKSRTIDGDGIGTILRNCGTAVVATPVLANALLDSRRNSSDVACDVAMDDCGSVDSSNSYRRPESPHKCDSRSQTLPKISDRQRKRTYRVGLNLFNKKPDQGIKYLIERKFLDNRPNAVARFLLARKGLSKLMIGEYLGNIQNAFNMEVLSCFGDQIDLAGLEVDIALRKFQSHFRMPGEAQKIERLMEAFANHYCDCNPDIVSSLHSTDSVFLLAFAIIMLNTDLHNSSIKPERKMKLQDFIRNLRGIDGGHDLDPDLLTGIYERMRESEFKPGSDHVGHVLKVEQMIVGKKPQLSMPHRRLVCYCRLYEVSDPLRRDKPGQHQREVFLFNDMIVVTKLLSKKKKNVVYSFRQSFSLTGMMVYLFESAHYKYGVRLVADGKTSIMFNARNDDDQSKFVDDLKEAILEMADMEALRIDEELKKQKFLQNPTNFNRFSKDSGVVDIEMSKMAESASHRLSAPECDRLKKTTLSSSLIDIGDGNRRASGASLDSGMQASAESGSTGSCQEAGRRLSRYLALQHPSAEYIAATAKKNWNKDKLEVVKVIT